MAFICPTGIMIRSQTVLSVESEGSLNYSTYDISHMFKKRECVRFKPSKKDPARCCCGRKDHCLEECQSRATCLPVEEEEPWNFLTHASLVDTDAYGTIEFQGGSHPLQAQYVRLACDTDPEDVLNLLTKVWHLRLPRLFMSIHGGKANFDLQPNLKKVIQEGLLKAAKTTETWIFTEGMNSGVVRHVGDALKNERAQTLQNTMATIGIVPWGIIDNRRSLIGRNVVTPYTSISSMKSKFPVLNDRHAFFLMVDDGTVEKYGCEIAFRRKLEKQFRNAPPLNDYNTLNGFTGNESQNKASSNRLSGLFKTERQIPMVGVVIEGGTNTIRTVLEYVTDTRPVPVVICDGSGRAADLLAFTHKYVQDNGTLPDTMLEHLLFKIRHTFDCSSEEAKGLLNELLECVKKKHLITVFRMGQGQDLDQAILTSLLKASGLNLLDQFKLVLTWDRADIASSELFALGQEWTTDMLDAAMMEALTVNSVDFVKLLLDNGVHLKRFLTFSRLEELYNSKRGPCNTLKHLVRDATKHAYGDVGYSLLNIGLVVEFLMGPAYQSQYRSRKFRERYENAKKVSAKDLGSTLLKHDQNNIKLTDLTNGDFQSQSNVSFNISLNIKAHSDSSITNNNNHEKQIDISKFFNNCNGNVMEHPCNELFIWAVLTKRQEMALFFWKKGEESIAKALVAVKLNKRMAQEAEQDDLKAGISEKFRKFSSQFEDLSVNLLDFIYRQNDANAQKLLTYELQNWGKQTCLTLAVSANHRRFLAHPCCQILIADLWLGGLRTRRNTNLKVFIGLMLPFLIPYLEFKSKKELKSMPQAEEDDVTLLDEDGNSIDIEKDASQVPKVRIYKKWWQESSPNGNRGVSELDIHATENESALCLRERFYEFYTSPLTKFMGYSMSYFAFLAIYSYLVLVRLRVVPSWQEIFCLIYILTLTIEKVREIAITEPIHFLPKFVMWVDSNKWNPCDIVAVVIYCIAFVVRLWPAHLEVAKVFYCVGIAYWFLKILHILGVNKYLGPFVTMIGKMVANTAYFVVLLLVVILAYGVACQGILNPHADPDWVLARNVFYKPYFMLYGEVFADSIDPPCGEGPGLEPCRTGRWVAILGMCLYLMVAYMLLVNLLIAVFNNIFLAVDGVAQQVWKAKRYSVVVEYEQKPVLPPPFIIINHIGLMLRYIRFRYQRKPWKSSPVLKLVLRSEELIALQNFEEHCVDGYFLEEEQTLKSSSSELVKESYHRVDYLTQQVNELYRRSSETLGSLRSLKYTIKHLGLAAKKTDGYLQVIHRYMCQQGCVADFGEFDSSENEGGTSCVTTSKHEDNEDLGDNYWEPLDGDVDFNLEHASLPSKCMRKRQRKMSCTSELSSNFPYTSENEDVNYSSDAADHTDPYRGPCIRNVKEDSFSEAKESSRRTSVAHLNLRRKSSSGDHSTGRWHRRRSVSQSLRRTSSSGTSKGPLPDIHIIPNSPIPEDVGLEALHQLENDTQMFSPNTPRTSSFPRNKHRMSFPHSRRNSGPTEEIRCANWLPRRSLAHIVAATNDAVFIPSNLQFLTDNQDEPGTPQTPEPRAFIHEYSSIMDEIETDQLFNNGNLAIRSPLNAPEIYNLALMRRLGGSCRSLTETEQAIIAKEEHLLEAEKQVYKQMEKESDNVLLEDTDAQEQSCNSLKAHDPTKVNLNRNGSEYSRSSARSRRSRRAKTKETDGEQTDLHLDPADSPDDCSFHSESDKVK